MAKTVPVFIKIEDIQPGEHGKNIYGKVVQSKMSTIITNNGENLQVAEGSIGDETATINFRIIGDFAKLLIKDRVVAFRNCRSEVVDEKNRLQIDKWGKISNEAVNIKIVKTDNNLSDILYEKLVNEPKQSYNNRKKQRNNNRNDNRKKKPYNQNKQQRNQKNENKQAPQQ